MPYTILLYACPGQVSSSPETASISTMDQKQGKTILKIYVRMYFPIEHPTSLLGFMLSNTLFASSSYQNCLIMGDKRHVYLDF